MCEGEREGRRQQKVSEDELGKGEGRTRESSRRGTIASSSSKKMMQGDEARARANTCLTARSLSPTYCKPSQYRPTAIPKAERTLLSSSGPLTEIKLALLSFATAFANNVLPHPGGPHSNTPHGA